MICGIFNAAARNLKLRLLGGGAGRGLRCGTGHGSARPMGHGARKDGGI